MRGTQYLVDAAAEGCGDLARRDEASLHTSGFSTKKARPEGRAWCDVAICSALRYFAGLFFFLSLRVCAILAACLSISWITEASDISRYRMQVT